MKSLHVWNEMRVGKITVEQKRAFEHMTLCFQCIQRCHCLESLHKYKKPFRCISSTWDNQSKHVRSCLKRARCISRCVIFWQKLTDSRTHLKQEQFLPNTHTLKLQRKNVSLDRKNITTGQGCVSSFPDAAYVYTNTLRP